MTKEHAKAAYLHYKDLLENPKYVGMKKVWKNNVQHGLDSILAKYPEFKKVEEEEEKTKSKGKKQ